MADKLRILLNQELSLKIGQQLRFKGTAVSAHLGNVGAKLSHSCHPTLPANQTASYQDVLFNLLNQARSSVLLQVCTQPNVDTNFLCEEIHKFCSRKGPVVFLGELQHPHGSANEYKQFIVEFGDSAALESLSLANAPDSVRTRVAQLNPRNLKLRPTTSQTEDRTYRHEKFISQLKAAQDVSEQMELFYRHLSLSPEALRARFLFASLVEDFINWKFDMDLSAVPFGTSYFGLATESSDVDISLTRLSLRSSSSLKTLTQLPLAAAQRYSNLQRSGAYSLLKAAGQEIEKHIAGLGNVNCLDALVPILTMRYAPLDLNLDVSLENRVGMKMAFCMNMYARLDPRVAPFLFLLRTWGRQRRIVMKPDSASYDGLTPFMLICIGLFYLMRVNPGVLPPMRTLLNKRPSDGDLFLGDFRCQLINDLSKIKPSENTSSLEELFMGFLEYIAKLNFSDWGLTLNSGVVIRNGQRHRLTIFVPFSDQSVGKNCSVQAALNLNKEAVATLRRLEFRGRKNKRYPEWGVLSIIDV